MTQIVGSLADIADDYDALLCDLWGCLHDGIRAHDEAVAALQTFREAGGAVVLLTNAPRPRADVARQIERMGVPKDAWDLIATSGDSARAAMFAGAVGQRVHVIGEDRGSGFFEPIGLVRDPIEIERVPLAEAEGIVCIGPDDPHADPSTYRPLLLDAKTRGLPLLSANPDIVVDRGERREWCAGALARLYDEMGGEVLSFGKPHPPIYDLARQRLAGLGVAIADDRILAIGDGIETDIRGAIGEGFDSMFVTGGLAAAATKTDRDPDSGALDALLIDAKLSPTYAIGSLR